MIARLARRILGALLLLAAARWAVIHFHATRPARDVARLLRIYSAPTYGQGLDVAGQPVRLRIRPLSPAELGAALAAEQAIAAERS